MKGILFIGIFLLMLMRALPGLAEDSLLFETWARSSFTPAQLDGFIQAHRAEYTDEYFRCSQEAQRLIREETKLRDRQCDFAPESGVRSRCRKENPFRGLDKHLVDLDQAIRNRTAWLDLESGRDAATAVRAAEDFEKSCMPSACDIAKRKKDRLLRDLRPYLQCPPRADSAIDVDPSFKSFQFPSDSGD